MKPLPRIDGRPDALGKTLAAMVENTGDAIAAFDLMRKQYELDRANTARVAFLAALETLEDEFVAHVFKTGSPTVVRSLLDRVEELSEAHQRALLSRRHASVTSVIRSKGLIGLAPREVQEEWATGEDLESRYAVILDPKIPGDLAERALEGVARAMVSPPPKGLYETLVQRFGYDQAIGHLVDDASIQSLNIALLKGHGDPETLRRIVAGWQKMVRRTVEQAVNDGFESENSAVRRRALTEVSVRLRYGYTLAKVTKRTWPKLAERLETALILRADAENLEEACAAALDENLLELCRVEDAVDVRYGSPRERVMSEGTVEDVTAEMEKAPLTVEELQLLRTRSADPTDEFSENELEILIIEKYPRTELAGAYYELATTAPESRRRNPVGSVLRLEDAARIRSLSKCIGSHDPEEIAAYVKKRGVQFIPLLTLSAEAPDLTLAEACLILGA